MKLANRKVRCPLCGAPNESDAARCSTCTRPLVDAPLASQRVYDETLWAEPIATKSARKPRSKVLMLSLGIVLILVVNYFFLKSGPDWAHEPPVTQPGDSWREFDAGNAATVDVPGTPIVAPTTLDGVNAQVSTLWVDGAWNVVFDASTSSTVDHELATSAGHGAIAIATSARSDQAPNLEALAKVVTPNAAFDSGATVPAQAEPNTEAWRWESGSAGWPTPNAEGAAYGRTIQTATTRVSIVTVMRTDDKGALLEALLDEVRFTTP